MKIERGRRKYQDVVRSGPLHVSLFGGSILHSFVANFNLNIAWLENSSLWRHDGSSTDRHGFINLRDLCYTILCAVGVHNPSISLCGSIRRTVNRSHPTRESSELTTFTRAEPASFNGPWIAQYPSPAATVISSCQRRYM